MDLEIGMMFWAGRDTLADVRGVGVSVGQLGIGPGVDLTPAFTTEWKDSLRRENFRVVTVVAAYAGEDYADIPTVQRTVGFIPPPTREAREKRTLAISDFAAELGVKSIGCHIGFVPEDASDPGYVAVRDMVRRVCDHAARHGQTFALETGQEPADTLLQFIKDTQRTNLKINFDPANMILYGTGDPIEAFSKLAAQVVSVHAKDGDWPVRDKPGSLGSERKLGEGSVGMQRFVEVMKQSGYRGTVNVEREIEDQAQRLADIRHAVTLLRGLIGHE